MANRCRLEAEPERIAAAIMESSTRAEAAKRLGVSDRTLYEYCKRFDVAAILHALRADQLRGRIQMLEEAQTQAVQTITDMLRSDDASNSDKLKAAALILQAGAAARSEYIKMDSDAVGRLRYANKLEAERTGKDDFWSDDT